MKNTAKTPNSNRGFNAQFLSFAPLTDPLVFDRVVASIDSVRIKYTYPKHLCNPKTFARTDTLAHLFDQLNSIPRWLGNGHEVTAGRYDIHTNYCAFKIGNYSHTLKYTLPNNDGFAVLLGRYHADKDGRYTMPEAILDFNPNKVPADIWHEVVSILAPLAISTTIQRFDLALDFDSPRSELQLVERPGSRYQQIREKGTLTEYTGERQHHGAIKLYDKGAELGHPEFNVSRCEITIDPKRLKSVKDLFPEIRTTAPLELTLGFSELPFPVQAVILHPELADLLKASCSPNTWRKHKAMIEGYGKTYYTLTDDQYRDIDTFVRNRLKEFTDYGNLILSA